MNSTMTINVRVVGRQAIAELRQVQAAVNNVGAGGINKGPKEFMSFVEYLNSNKFIRAAQRLNFLGRQLTYNITLPFVALATTTTRANFAIETSMKRVIKVYGDLSYATDQGLRGQGRIKEETDALAKSFELLSTRFGVHQEEVIDIAAAWASAGSAGRGLAENVKLTLEAMILGELEATEATEGLIAIQAQWGLSTVRNAQGVSEMSLALAQLNIIENQTGVTMQGLIEALQRSSGAARVSGMSFVELSAMVAALVPAAGTAANAGNALKTIIASLQAPTQEVIDTFKLMGIEVNSPEWLGKSVTQKIEAVAEKFEGLSTANQAFVSEVLGGKWQISRFAILMQDLTSETGYYQRAIDAAGQSSKQLTDQYNRELLTVLESNPKKWDIMTNAIRNTLAKAMIPMIPVILSVLQFVMRLTQAFGNLSPEVQRWIIIGLGVLALVGPLAQVTNSFVILGGVAVAAMKHLAAATLKYAIPAIASLKYYVVMAAHTIAQAFVAASVALGIPLWAVVGIVAAVVAAIVLVIKYDLVDEIWAAIKSVANAFAALPQVIVNVFNSIIRIIDKAIAVVREGLSYLNPFARHSPSLVDNVRAGVSVILDEYKKFAQIPSLIRSATDALDTFSQVAAPGMKSAREAELSDIQTKISKNDPAAGEAAGGVIQSVLALEAQLPGLAREIAQQEQVVSQWSEELKQANAVLDAAEARLSAAEREFDRIGKSISDAKDRISELSNMPIAGMMAMEDQIFENEMAQKRLNLQLLEFERRGESIEDVREKFANLNGEIEMLQGEKQSLRLLGAGSEILGVYDDQISSIQEQQRGLQDTQSEIENIQRQLDDLDLEGRWLQLTRDITFEPLERQIDRLVTGVEEMSFDDIVAGIQEQQALIAELQPQYDAIALTIEREKVAIEEAKSARDEVASQLDAEQEKLSNLEDAYSSIESLIREMVSAMSDYADESERAAKAKSAADEVDLFSTGANSNFDIQGGTSSIAPEGNVLDIEAFNSEMEAQLQEAIESMGTLDIFGGIKEQWNRLVDWFKANAGWLLAAGIIVALGVVFTPLVAAVAALIMAIGYVFMRYGGTIWNWVNQYVVQPIWRALLTVADFIMNVWNTYIWPVIQWIITNIGGPLVTAFQVAFDIVMLIIQGFVTYWQIVWAIVSGVVGFAWSIIGPILEEVIDFIVQDLWPIITTLGDIAYAIFVDVIAPAADLMWEIVKAVFMGVWEILSKWVIPILQLFWAIGEIVFVTIGRIIEGAWNNVIYPVLNALWWFIREVLGPTFEWLWNDIITPVWDGITNAIDFAWNNGIEPIFDSIKWGIENILGPAFTWILDNIVRPVFKGIIYAIGWAWDKIATIIEGGVNFLGDAFNLIAGVINKIADFLNIDVTISQVGDVSLPRLPYDMDVPSTMSAGGGGGGGARFMASGGIVPADGGVFSEARAIIGEGSKVWPEFVIPTDPRYRSRAHGLLGDLHNRIGGSMVPTYAMGGVVGAAKSARNTMETFEDRPKHDEIGGWGPIGWAYNQGKNLVNGVVDLAKEGALKALWTPVKWAAENVIDMIEMPFISNIGKGVIGSIDDWVNGGESAIATKVASVPIPKSGQAGSWKVIPQLLDRLKIPYEILSTYRPGATTRFSGSPSWHAKDQAIDLAGPTWLNHPQMLKIADAIYDFYKPHLHELIYGGPGAKNVYEGRDHRYGKFLLDEHVNHVHAALARGGFTVPRVPGGALFRIGEGLYDEAVQVTPLHGGNDGEGGNTYIFYGDLSFPEIKSGDDAERFLANLESLATPRGMA